MPFVIIRFFGVYGPKQHRSWSGGPQSVFIDRISAGNPVEIHGSGNQTRTFIYIDDVINALKKIIVSKKCLGKIINLGTSREISIIDLAHLISKLMNKKLKVKKVPYQSFTGKKYEDVQKRAPSIKRAKNLINWEPKISLEEGLSKTINWQLKTK